jgi:hypothetical protein
MLMSMDDNDEISNEKNALMLQHILLVLHVKFHRYHP